MRLTDEEREIRSSRGIGLRRWWPLAALTIAIVTASTHFNTLERCTGMELDGGRRAGAAIRALLAYPCSLSFLTGAWPEWLTLAGMWLPIPFAYLNWRWAQRHEAYWDVVRQREKARRAEKREKKRHQNES